MIREKKKISFVVGARPNFVKAAPVIREFKKYPQFDCHVVHTGQHYDKNMSDVFFGELGMDPPNVNLEVGSGSQAVQTANVMLKIEKYFKDIIPDWVFVFGDINSTLAATLTAQKLGIKIAHVESGLRSGDMSMPEEINRILTDRISDLCFVTEPSGEKNLLREGIPQKKIQFVGNTMIDSLIFIKEKLADKNILNEFSLRPKEYIMVTLHRPSNVDNRENLMVLIDSITRWNSETDIIWPVHPRNDLTDISLNSQWIKIKPLPYISFLSLVSQSKGVFTDSGGIQEETTFLNIPCFTLRDNTERPVTCEVGTNTLVKNSEFRIQNIWTLKKNRDSIPKFWDSVARKRIVNYFIKLLSLNLLLTYVFIT